MFLTRGSRTGELGAYVLAFGALLVAVFTIASTVFYRRSFVERSVFVFVEAFQLIVGRISGRIYEALERDEMSDRVSGFYETIDLLAAHRRDVAIAAVVAHVAMIFFLLPVYTTALALGHPIPFAAVALIVAISKLGALVPMPGGLGGVEVATAGAIYLVAGFGIEVATTIALLYRLCTYWFTVAVGGVSTVYLSVRA